MNAVLWVLWIYLAAVFVQWLWHEFVSQPLATRRLARHKLELQARHEELRTYFAKHGTWSGCGDEGLEFFAEHGTSLWRSPQLSGALSGYFGGTHPIITDPRLERSSQKLIDHLPPDSQAPAHMRLQEGRQTYERLPR